MNKRYLVVCLLTFCLTATLLIGVTSSAPYDPWVDGNDDGIIDIVDIVNLAIRFGEEGTPINKTELLLDLQGRIDSLNATVEALKTMVQQKGNISVPAAAFTPTDPNKDWRNQGDNLVNFEASGSATFYAGVQLPHGATVTNLTSYWYDINPASRVYCSLYRFNQTSLNTLATATGPVSDMPGLGSYAASTIWNPTVDNNKYAYILYVQVPTPWTDYRFQLAVIEYEYPA